MRARALAGACARMHPVGLVGLTEFACAHASSRDPGDRRTKNRAPSGHEDALPRILLARIALRPYTIALIKEYLNAEKHLAVTSDLWHVVHAELSAGHGTPSFTRTIVSEHDSSASALEAARVLKSQLVRRMKSRSRDEWDQVMVKRPSAETLKSAGRITKGKKPLE